MKTRWRIALPGVALMVAAIVHVAEPARGFGAREPHVAPPREPWPLVIEPTSSPARAGSGQPQLTVEGHRAVLSWIERDGDRATLRFAEAHPSGWSEARTVATGTNWFVNWADVPSVIRLAGGTLAAHWLQKSAASTYAYDVRLSFSKDDGRTWSSSITPHHDGTPTEHGFASLFQAPGAGLGVIWLDGRAMKPHAPESDPEAGNMTVRAATFDRDGKQLSESLIDDRVCECCPTAVAVTSEGALAAFRDRSPDEIRDIHVSRLAGGPWTTPAPAHRDNWKIAACPVNGPALSARDRDVAIAWFTAQADRGHVFVAFSRDAGRSFGEAIGIEDVGALGRVDVELLADGSAAVSWIEFADGRAQFRLRRVTRDGERSPSLTAAGISANRSSGYPRMARTGSTLLFAWTDTTGGASSVRTAVAHLKN